MAVPVRNILDDTSYKHKHKTFVKCIKASNLKTSVQQNRSWRTLLFSATQRHLAIIGNSPYVDCQQGKLQLRWGLFDLQPRKIYRDVSHLIPIWFLLVSKQIHFHNTDIKASLQVECQTEGFLMLINVIHLFLLLLSLDLSITVFYPDVTLLLLP
jgi:hypothetical protein